MGRTRAGAGGGMRASTTGIDVTPARGPGQCEGLLLTILLTILLIAAMGRMHLASMPVLATVTAALSNLVSNVPAVLRSSTIHSAPGSWSRWPPRSPAISPWSDRSRTTDLIASSMYRAHSI